MSAISFPKMFLLKWWYGCCLRPFQEAATASTYRLALVVKGNCVLRYDNEAGKGDHKHLDEDEIPYVFSSPEELLDDFWNDVDNWRF